MSIELEISEAWQQAAVDLGLTVHAAEAADCGEEDRVAYAVRVDDFGSPAGTVCRYYEAPQIELYRLHAWAQRVGLFVSLLARPYSTYKRDLFLSTLDDWGWFGVGKPPGWYSGQVWGTGER